VHRPKTARTGVAMGPGGSKKRSDSQNRKRVDLKVIGGGGKNRELNTKG